MRYVLFAVRHSLSAVRQKSSHPLSGEKRRANGEKTSSGLSGALRWRHTRHGFRVLVPVDIQFFGAVENDVVAGASEIPPRPLDESLDLGERGGQQRGMNAQPGGKRDRALQLVAVLANLGDSGVASDHRHDAFIEILKLLPRLALKIPDDVLRAPLA